MGEKEGWGAGWLVGFGTGRVVVCWNCSVPGMAGKAVGPPFDGRNTPAGWPLECR